jgi:hypothetical protein
VVSSTAASRVVAVSVAGSSTMGAHRSTSVVSAVAALPAVELDAGSVTDPGFAFEPFVPQIAPRTEIPSTPKSASEAAVLPGRGRSPAGGAWEPAKSMIGSGER